MPFDLAVTLIDGGLSVDSYSDERTRDPRVHALMDRVVPLEDATLAFPGDYPAWIRVRLKNGQELERRVPKVAGSLENPMPASEYESKFVDNARRSIGVQRAQAVVRLMRDLPSVIDIARIANACA